MLVSYQTTLNKVAPTPSPTSNSFGRSIAFNEGADTVAFSGKKKKEETFISKYGLPLLLVAGAIAGIALTKGKLWGKVASKGDKTAESASKAAEKKSTEVEAQVTPELTEAEKAANLAAEKLKMRKRKISLRYITRGEKKRLEGIELYNNKDPNWQKAHQKAIAYLGKAIEFDRENTALLNRRGVLFFEVNDIENAIAHHRKAIQVNPQDYLGYMNMANLLAAINPNEAMFYINKASQLSPLHPDVAKVRDKVVHELKTNPKFSGKVDISPEKLASLQEEESVLTAQIEASPENYSLYADRAAVLKQQQRYADALKDYTTAVELRPDFADGFVEMGLMYKKLKNHKTAIKAYDRAIALNPLHSTAYYNKSVALVEISEPYSALESLDIALKISPEDESFRAFKRTINDMLGKKEI